MQRSASFFLAQSEKARTLKDKRRVGPNEHRNTSGTSDGPRSSSSVDSNVSCHDKRVPSVPARALDPVDRVEQGGGSSVAGVLGVDPLNVRVAGEEVHKVGLDRLGFVDKGLRADVDTADRGDGDLVLGEERGSDCGSGEAVSACLLDSSLKDIKSSARA